MRLAPIIGAALVLGCCSVANAEHTQDAVVYDPATGVVVMIVIPADDKELTDPAFNPPGLVQQTVPHKGVADPNNAADMITDVIAEARVLAPNAHIVVPGPPAVDVQPVLEGTDVQVTP